MKRDPPGRLLPRTHSGNTANVQQAPDRAAASKATRSPLEEQIRCAVAIGWSGEEVEMLLIELRRDNRELPASISTVSQPPPGDESI
jgi:hypothetical protein